MTEDRGFIPRRHRVSIDIDEENKFQLLKKYLTLSKYGKVQAYKTGGGYHLQIRIQDRTIEENLFIREMVGDCHGRLNLDYIKLECGLPDWIETIFYEKERFNKKTFERLYNVMSEPWFMVKE